jgi:MFS family permease
LKLKPLYLLVTLSTLGHVAMAGTRITLILDAVHQGASPALVGIISALLSTVAMFTSVWAGRWVDRAGPRQPIIIGCVMASAGMALGWFWPTLTALFIVSAISGTFNNVFFIVNQNLVGLYGKPEDRVSNFSLQGLGYSTAAFIGPILAGFSIDTFGHPFTFLLMAVIAAIPAIVVGLNQLEFPPRRPHVAHPEGGASGGSALNLMRNPELGPIFYVSVLSQATWNLFSFLMPIHLTSYHFSASLIGSIVASFYFASMVSRFFLPAIARRFTPWQLLIASFFGGSASFVGFTLTGNVVLIVAFALFLGSVLGFTGPMILTLMHECSPPGRTGEVVGVRIMLMNICQTFIPLLSGALGAAFGVAPAFWALSAILLSGGWTSVKQSRLAGPRRAP